MRREKRNCPASMRNAKGEMEGEELKTSESWTKMQSDETNKNERGGGQGYAAATGEIGEKMFSLGSSSVPAVALTVLMGVTKVERSWF